jgi:hypothetical protein
MNRNFIIIQIIIKLPNDKFWCIFKIIQSIEMQIELYYTDYTSVIVQSFLGRIGLNWCYIPACIAIVFLLQTHQYQRGWLALTILKIKNSLDYF